MSLVDDFMLSYNDECDTTMGTASMVCNGQTFPVVDNVTSKQVDGEFGGLEPQVRGIVTAQPSDVTSPLAMLNAARSAALHTVFHKWRLARLQFISR